MSRLKTPINSSTAINNISNNVFCKKRKAIPKKRELNTRYFKDLFSKKVNNNKIEIRPKSVCRTSGLISTALVKNIYVVDNKIRLMIPVSLLKILTERW
jgi:hypothetical protein